MHKAKISFVLFFEAHYYLSGNTNYAYSIADYLFFGDKKAMMII